jgi:hypothetical protein
MIQQLGQPPRLGAAMRSPALLRKPVVSSWLLLSRTHVCSSTRLQRYKLTHLKAHV